MRTSSRFLGAVALAAALASPAAPAAAAVWRSGDIVTIPATETIQDDLYVAGGRVEVLGRITGDLVVAGGNVVVRGPVEGDVIAAGGEVRLEGRVGQSVRAVGGSLELRNGVAGDLVAAAGRLTTAGDLVAKGDAMLAGGELVLGGQLGRSLRAGGGTIRLNGEVAGPASLTAPEVRVASGAVVAGPLEVVTRTVEPLAAGATVRGPLTRRTLTEATSGSGFGGWLFGFLMALTAGITLLWLLPEAADRSGEAAARTPGWRMLAGVLALIGAPLAAALAMVTVVGIPLGLILLAGYFVALYLAQLVVAWTAGRRLFELGQARVVGFGPRVGALALGLLLVYLVRAIPLLGPLATFVVVVWGLGTIATLLYERLRARHAPGPEPAPTV